MSNLQSINTKIDSALTSLSNISTNVSGVASGGATSANQVIHNTKLDTINSTIGSSNTKLDTANTTLSAINIYSAGSNTKLDSIITNTNGLATASNQSTANTHLSSVVTNTANTSSNVSSMNTNLGTKLDSVVSNTSGLATASNQSTANTSLSSINTSIGSSNTKLDSIITNTNGLATSANQSTANSSLSSIATNTSNINTTLTADIFQILNGQKNSYTRNMRVVGSSASGERILQDGLSSLTSFSRPSANRKIRIYSSSAGDTAQMVIHYVAFDGTRSTVNLTLNGTTSVDSSAIAVMVNNVVPVSAYPVGSITVKIDNDGNDSFSTTLGVFSGNVYATTLHVVPSGRKAIVNRLSGSNYTSNAVTFRYVLRAVNNWINGNTVIGDVAGIHLGTGNSFTQDCVTQPIIFSSGTFFYGNIYTSSAAIPVAEMQIVEYDV